MSCDQMINLIRQVHIDELGSVLGCHIIQKHNMPGMMYVEYGYIEGPVISNQIDYF